MKVCFLECKLEEITAPVGLSEMSNTYSWQAGRDYNMNVCRFQNVRKTGSTFFSQCALTHGQTQQK